MANYTIKITRGGLPVKGACVRVPGVGVNDTDTKGKTVISGVKKISRGAAYAWRTKKFKGDETDEPDRVFVMVSLDGYAGGHYIDIAPDGEATIDLDGV